MPPLPETASPPSLAARLWTYQAERFPLAKTLPLLVVFSAASVTISATLAGRNLPGLWAYAAAFLVVLVLFFQMRVADEFKDHEDDCRYRPERPVPRGLIELSLLGRLAASAGVVAFVVILLSPVPSAICLLAVWVWLTAMTREFWVEDWLKARPVIYLVSHMAIMPLIDLLLTSFEWGRSGDPAPGLWVFLALSFVNGVVLEIGRKLWAPEAEREGVETYSKLWGPARAATVWAFALIGAYALLVTLGLYLNAVSLWVFVGLGGASLGACALLAGAYAKRPSPQGQARLDAASGLWVVMCYGTAGLVPWLTGGAA